MQPVERAASETQRLRPTATGRRRRATPACGRARRRRERELRVDPVGGQLERDALAAARRRGRAACRSPAGGGRGSARSAPITFQRAPGREAAAVGLDARDAGPPVGEVVRLGEERPDVVERREERRGQPRTVARNSWPPSIRSSSALRSVVVELRDARVRRVARHLLDAEVAVGERRDLRQVRDRDHLRALGEPLQRPADGVRRLAADAGVDLVEDQRLAARDRGDRERDARELAARRRLGDRARTAGPRSGGRGRPPRRRPVAPGSRSRELADELALAHADVVQLGRDGVGERGRRGVPLGSQLDARARDARLAPRPAACRGRRAGSTPSSSAVELGARLGGAREQLLVGLAAEAALGVGDPVERALELLEPARLGLERGEERVQLATPSRAGAARRRGARRRRAASSGASRSSGATARSASATRPAAPSPSSGVERRGRGGRGLRELGDVAQPLALGAQRAPRRPAPGRRCPRRARAARRAAPPRARRSRSAPRAGAGRRAARARRSRASARRRELLLAAEPVEHLELVRRAARAGAARTARTSRRTRSTAAATSSRAAAPAPRVRARAARRRRRAARRGARPRPPAAAPPSSSSSSGRSSSAST